jgi:diaminopimelate decarboxylase
MKSLKLQNILDLVTKYATPLYVYDLDTIKTQYDCLRLSIPKQVKIFYALKANSNPSICAFIHSLGAGAEIASSGELCIALKSGFLGSKIIYNGPGKTDDDIAYAIENNIHLLNVESIDELYRINTIAEQAQCLVKICVRINPLSGATQAKMHTGGDSQKFGIDEEKVGVLIEAALKLDWVKLSGIHIYVGSQILSHKVLLNSIENTLNIACKLAKQYQLQLKTINLGGGLGVPYTDAESEFDVEQFGAGLTKIIEEISKCYDLSETELILEPGRFLVSDAGILLTKVLSVKESRGKKYAIVDSGINHALLPFRMNKKYSTVIANKIDQAIESKVIIGGALCTSMDAFTTEVELPNIEVNDIICIFNAGAYGFSASLLYFLSAPMPAEVIIDNNGQDILVRRRGRKEDFLLGTDYEY